MNQRKAAFSMWTSALIQIIGATIVGAFLIDEAPVWAIALSSLGGWVLLMFVLWTEAMRGNP